MLVNVTTAHDASFREVCKQNNWRRTAQRRAVFDCLCGNRRHPSVESIWSDVRRKLPDVSLDSIYRILDAFTEAGLVRRLEGDRMIRYDPDTTPHGHFICTVCGRLFDFPYGADKAAAACEGLGRVTTVEITVRGLCAKCGGAPGNPLD